MKKVICAHLYNDFSGSPLVLSTVIKGLVKKGLEVELMSSGVEKGFLSKLNIPLRDNAYKFHQNKFLRLLAFLICQIRMFVQALRYRNDDQAIFYINTLLPFGVALAGKLINKKVVYHIHETSVRPAFLKGFLKWVAKFTADELIYVSKFLKKEEEIEGVSANVIYNALSQDFVKEAQLYQKNNKIEEDFTVLMLCSLKSYKGVFEFVTLASKLPSLKFELVLNATEEEIYTFFKEVQFTENLSLFPKQSNVHQFYRRANLVVNLSDPQLWIETFGMTLLEGMQYGIPAIAPTVGGPAELVSPGINGYQIDQKSLDVMIEEISNLSNNPQLYKRLSSNARRFAATFKVESMQSAVHALLV